ncbi:MAG: SDR family oxidoreductase, partial [Thermoplasmata archaeon]|nr:SDR family oxidoreductase [Thermoplasmata archaeon]
MKGKVCMITGANSGIGKVMALDLAKMGANVVMVCRSKERGEAAQRDIVNQSGNESVELMLADLSSMGDVRELAEEFRKKHDRLDVLINNATLWPTKKMMTKEGLEMQFATNHLSHFLLTNLLLDMIKDSAPARIINVSSGLHRRAKIDFDNLQAEKSYRHMGVYGRTKLANVYFTKELARRLNGTDVTVNAFTPGLASTNLGRYMNGFSQWFMRTFSKSAESGAETGVYLATSPEVERMTGKYFANSKETKSSKISYDVEIAKRLWKVGCSMFT